jgi:hypothetical protein
MSAPFQHLSTFQFQGLPLAQYRPKVPFCIPLFDVDKLSHGILSWFLAQESIPPVVHTFFVNLNSSPTDLEAIRQYSETMGLSVQNLHIIAIEVPILYVSLTMLDMSMSLS